MSRLSKSIGLIVFTFVVTLWAPTNALSQEAHGEGYAIVTTRDTILGEHACYPGCLVDEECPERQSCIALPNLDSFCLPLPEMEPLPVGWSGCEADLGCGQDTVCVRRRAPQRPC